MQEFSVLPLQLRSLRLLKKKIFLTDKINGARSQESNFPLGSQSDWEGS